MNERAPKSEVKESKSWKNAFTFAASVAVEGYRLKKTWDQNEEEILSVVDQVGSSLKEQPLKAGSIINRASARLQTVLEQDRIRRTQREMTLENDVAKELVQLEGARTQRQGLEEASDQQREAVGELTDSDNSGTLGNRFATAYGAASQQKKTEAAQAINSFLENLLGELSPQ